MRYKLDVNGYIDCVLWGCYTGTCQEYTGTVPSGYETLTEWADNAIINAYYIDDSGNLALDAEREADLKIKIDQQTKDYTPVLRRELYETAEVLDSQYVKDTASGKFIVIDNVKNIPPVVTLSDLQEAENVTIFAHTRNMLPVGKDGISGSATIGDNTEPLFALLAGEKYCLNIGNHTCEMLYYDGETTEQVYSGGGGIISISENKKVTQVKITGEGTLYPTLNPGTEAIEFEEGKIKSFTTVANDSVVTISEGVNLHNGYNLVYTDQGNEIFMEYSTTGLTGSVGGWKIDGNALWCDIIPPDDYTEEDITKIQEYIVGLTTLTDAEFTKYDMNNDGKVNSLDLLYVRKIIDAGISRSYPGRLLLDTSDYYNPIKMLDGNGKTVAAFGVPGITPDPTFKIADYIVETDTNGIWEYEKWNSGKAVCRCKYTGTGKSTSGNNETVTLPFEFNDTDYKVFLTPENNGSVVTSYGDYGEGGNVAHTKTSFVFRYVVSHAYIPTFNIEVKGTWK